MAVSPIHELPGTKVSHRRGANSVAPECRLWFHDCQYPQPGDSEPLQLHAIPAQWSCPGESWWNRRQLFVLWQQEFLGLLQQLVWLYPLPRTRGYSGALRRSRWSRRAIRRVYEPLADCFSERWRLRSRIRQRVNLLEQKRRCAQHAGRPRP